MAIAAEIVSTDPSRFTDSWSYRDGNRNIMMPQRSDERSCPHTHTLIDIQQLYLTAAVTTPAGHL